MQHVAILPTREPRDTEEIPTKPLYWQPVHRAPYRRSGKSCTSPPVKPVAVWANESHKTASWLGLDSPLVGGTTIKGDHGLPAGRHDNSPKTSFA